MMRSIAVMNQICKVFALLSLSIILLGCKPADSSHPETPKSPPSKSTSSDKPISHPDEAAEQVEDQAETHLFINPEQVLIEGEYQAEIIGLVYSERMEYLAGLVKKAANNHPEWWKESLKNSSSGEPIPYDEKLGMTEAEYEEFLASALTPEAKVIGHTTVTIMQPSSNTFVLDGGKNCPDLSGITIDLNTNTIHTKHATLPSNGQIDAQNVPIGSWTGVSWKYSDVDPETITGVYATFGLGVRGSDGKAVVYYKYIDRTLEQDTRNNILLLFSLPE